MKIRTYDELAGRDFVYMPIDLDTHEALDKLNLADNNGDPVIRAMQGNDLPAFIEATLQAYISKRQKSLDKIDADAEQAARDKQLSAQREWDADPNAVADIHTTREQAFNVG